MDIKEAMIHKNNAEIEIKSSLNRFIQLTGLDTTYVSAKFQTQEYLGGTKEIFCEKVDLEIRL